MQGTNTWIESTVVFEDCTISERASWIRHGTVLKCAQLGGDIFIGFKCSITNASIDDGTQLAARVILLGTPTLPITIGRYCWLGGGVEVQAGVSIAEGSVIGADSYVDTDIPPYSIAVGRPARIIRQRQVIHDAPPGFADFLAVIRQRDEALGIPPQGQGFINAEISASGSFTLGQQVYLVGRKASNGQGGLALGEQVTIASHTILEGIGGITIGDYTIIDEGAMIFTTTHDYTRLSLPQLRKAVVIGSHVLVGKNAIILAGVTIHNRAYIEPHALVMKDVAPGEVVKKQATRQTAY
jgi:acetyltransferase-like isoleucine patch superfamily enzyme